MTSEALFGLSILMNLVAWGIVALLFIWPRLRGMRRDEALLPLVVPHTFRGVGLSFLIPGVVAPNLSPAFANQAAYGDLGAALLAMIATVALWYRASWALLAVWIFNLWGTADLVNAFYQANAAGVSAGQLGATYFIPTFIVPLLLVTHGLGFRILLQHHGEAVVRESRQPA